MAEEFVVSDTHHGHQGMVEFLRRNGAKLRPFSTVEEMDEAMVANWNRVVPVTGAKVRHLGDVVMKAKQLPILNRLNGKKRLYPGNHDIFSAKEYLKYFYDVGTMRVDPSEKIVMTHLPLHPSTFEGWVCVHGHTHDSVLPDPSYLNVCVERTLYHPIPYGLVLDIVREQRKLGVPLPDDKMEEMVRKALNIPGPEAAKGEL